MTGKPQEFRSITRNRKARHAYEILEELECGIVLKGTEVKSLRSGHGSMAEAYGRIRGGERFLVGANSPEYRYGNVFNHPPVRDRKLLAHAREIAKWTKKVRERGMTLVPLEVYFQGSRITVKLALCRGKRLYDKRETQRKRDDERTMDRARMRRR